MPVKKRDRPTKKQLDKLRVQVVNLRNALRGERQLKRILDDNRYVELLQAYDRANVLITKIMQQNERMQQALLRRSIKKVEAGGAEKASNVLEAIPHNAGLLS